MPDPADRITDVPRMIAERDDRVSSGRGRDAAPRSRASRGASDSPTNGGGAGGFISFVAVLAFLIAGGASYAAWELYQQNLQLNATLGQAGDRISELENRLSSTDDSMSQSTAAMAVKIKELYSEVDKLWASAWRKNKERLGVLEEQQKKLTDAQAATNKNLSGVSAQAAEMKKQQALLNQQVAAAQEVAITLATLKEQITEQANSIGKLNSVANTVQSTATGNSQRLRDVEQWVQSNIEFRKQVSARLSQLEAAQGVSTPAAGMQ